MKVLLDENLPHKLRRAIAGHEVYTVGYLGWNGLTNGRILAAAEDAALDVMVAADRSLHFEQNLATRRVAVVSLSAQKWPDIRDHISKVQAAIDASVRGSFQMVDCE